MEGTALNTDSPLDAGNDTGTASEFRILWEFHVEAPSRAQFERIYGSDGDWARLFSRAPGFRGTQLLHDPHDPDRYVTLDCWQDEAAFRAFHERWHPEYDALDRRCEGLAASEVLWGRFTVVAAVPR
jgi:heme-degrading monooxygenase HmoA